MVGAECTSLRLKSDHVTFTSHVPGYHGKPAGLYIQPRRMWGSSQNPLLNQNEGTPEQQPELKLKKGKIDTIVKGKVSNAVGGTWAIFTPHFVKKNSKNQKNLV